MDSGIAGLTDFLTSPETSFSFRNLSRDGWTLWISYKLCSFLIAWQMKPTPNKTEVQEKEERQLEWILNWGGGGGGWKKKFCSHLQMKCSCVSILASARSKIGKMECDFVTVEEFCLLCDHLLLKRGWGETALFTVCGSMSNLYLIYDISHKSSDQRHDPGVFLQIAFSVPQQLWNYSSSRKPLSWTRWSPRMAVAILIWNSSEKVISWS